MPVFECTKCGCIENTACSNYWIHTFKPANKGLLGKDEITDPLCSECDPDIGKWHNKFPKMKVDWEKLEKNESGFLQAKEE